MGYTKNMANVLDLSRGWLVPLDSVRTFLKKKKKHYSGLNRDLQTFCTKVRLRADYCPSDFQGGVGGLWLV